HADEHHVLVVHLGDHAAQSVGDCRAARTRRLPVLAEHEVVDEQPRVRATSSAPPRSRTRTPSPPAPRAAPAAAPRRAWRAPRARARRPVAPGAPPATPAPYRPSSDLLRVDLVLVGPP